MDLRLTSTPPHSAAGGISVAAVPDAKAVMKSEKAARDFEALLLTPVLDSLQKTFSGDGDDKTTGASDYRAMGTQALAQAIADRGGIGIARLIFDHLQLHHLQPPKVSGEGGKSAG